MVHLIRVLLFVVVLCQVSVSRAAGPGLLRNTPVYCQELHIWYRLPFPDTNEEFNHQQSRLTSQKEPWRLDWDKNGYPMVGLYSSSNVEIIRWQLRCAKAAGLTSVAVQIFPEIKEGLSYLWTPLIKQGLDTAAEEKFPIFFMDEVAFRKQSIAQDPRRMAARVITFLKEFGQHPGFYKIDGKPVFYYQIYGYRPGLEATRTMMAEVEKAAGPVSWMIFGPVTEGAQLPFASALVSSANLSRYETYHRTCAPHAFLELQATLDLGHCLHKTMGTLVYFKFDDTSAQNRGAVRLYSEDGSLGVNDLTAPLAPKPDFLMLSSWNDWGESTNIEPGWDFDGFTGDPYKYLRLIAQLKGIEFNPPPLPPKSALHPSIWERLGMGDGAGPIIDSVSRENERGGTLRVEAHDTINAVQHLEVVWKGDLWWTAAPDDGSSQQDTLRCAKGKIDPPKSIVNSYGLNAGEASRVASDLVSFTPGQDTPSITEQPYMGVVYAFDPGNPWRGPAALVDRKTAGVLAEPEGKNADKLLFDFKPYPKNAELNREVWDGWRTSVAKAYAPIVAFDKAHEIQVRARDLEMAYVGFLGLPKKERLTDRAPQPRDASGRTVTWFLPIPLEILRKPGVSFVWIRAEDAAGNWGDPYLYPVPNYQAPP